MIYTMHYSSPVGVLTVAADQTHIIGLWIEGQKHFCASLTEIPVEGSSQPVLQQTASWLDRYFAGLAPSPEELPLLTGGTDFQQQVWRILLQIPYGTTVTYAAIARRLGKGGMTARAVGSAVSRNPISIIIPCHRVMGSSGALTGYAAGIEKKTALLKLEGFLI